MKYGKTDLFFIPIWNFIKNFFEKLVTIEVAYGAPLGATCRKVLAQSGRNFKFYRDFNFGLRRLGNRGLF